MRIQGDIKIQPGTRFKKQVFGGRYGKESFGVTVELRSEINDIINEHITHYKGKQIHLDNLIFVVACLDQYLAEYDDYLRKQENLIIQLVPGIEKHLLNENRIVQIIPDLKEEATRRSKYDQVLTAIRNDVQLNISQIKITYQGLKDVKIRTSDLGEMQHDLLKKIHSLIVEIILGDNWFNNLKVDNNFVEIFKAKELPYMFIFKNSLLHVHSAIKSLLDVTKNLDLNIFRITERLYLCLDYKDLSFDLTRNLSGLNSLDYLKTNFKRALKENVHERLYELDFLLD